MQSNGKNTLSPSENAFLFFLFFSLLLCIKITAFFNRNSIIYRPPLQSCTLNLNWYTIELSCLKYKWPFTLEDVYTILRKTYRKLIYFKISVKLMEIQMLFVKCLYPSHSWLFECYPYSFYWFYFFYSILQG